MLPCVVFAPCSSLPRDSRHLSAPATSLFSARCTLLKTRLCNSLKTKRLRTIRKTWGVYTPASRIGTAPKSSGMRFRISLPYICEQLPPPGFSPGSLRVFCCSRCRRSHDNPASPGVQFSLAKAYARSKQPEKAEKEREEFVPLNALAEKNRGSAGNPSSGAAEMAVPG
jgi:hypothetical protein